MVKDVIPLVSIIIVTYKPNLNYIFETITSIRRQTYKNIEIIIINDRSTDEVEDYFVNLEKNNNDILYISNSSKKGVSVARNQGIMLCKGKYIAMIDDDDLRNDENKIKKQIEFLENHNDYGLVGVKEIININESGKEIERIMCRTNYSDIKNHLLQSNQFAQSGIVIRKEILNKIGIYDTSCFTEDYDLWCRIGIYYKFCNLESSISYRILNSSLSHSNKTKVRKAAFKTFRKYKKYYPNALRAFILRIGELLIPETTTKKILNIIK